MSASMYRADRNTHIKVAVVSCLCAIVVVTVGLTARMGDLTVAGTVARSGVPTAVSNTAENTIR